MQSTDIIKEKIRELINNMTTEEKVGQLCLINSYGKDSLPFVKEKITSGKAGAILNEVDVHIINELQRAAAEESRLGIPLLVGRDVIHGFKTIFPIPLGQAASWNPDLIEQAAHAAAVEASASGVNWTFAPMLDIGRDPRWGRVAETLGEDPYLTGILGTSMVRGFQGDDLSQPGSIAACAKHFAGYGASESGRDYNTTSIPEVELRNTHLPPFKKAVDAGAASVMVSFSDVNGVPASANEFLLKQILRTEWGYDGFVVSDWESIAQLKTHGLTSSDKESAFEAASAGLDMEMASSCYENYLAELVNEGKISSTQLDSMVANVLRIKFQLGLFENPYTDPAQFPEPVNREHSALAQQLATQSIVLLKNENSTLPIKKESLKSVAVIGPLADDGYEQLGTWVFDGDSRYSQTPLQSLKELLGNDVVVHYEKALATTRSRDKEWFARAKEISQSSDVTIMFLGEESILSGEAHCRADIGLPGIQTELIKELASAGKKIIAVVMAGRPLALENIIHDVDALLFAWHGGIMSGPAITNILFGIDSPSGKLPVTFPRVTGQIPMYYSQKNTGKPVTPQSYIHIDDIPQRSGQVSVGNTSYHLDVHYTPLFPFGFGLSYTTFSIENISTSASQIRVDDSIMISAEVTNTGNMEADEIVQLYIRDVAASITRPVKELKGFHRVHLKPGEKQSVSFTLTKDDLAFYGRDMKLKTEPGKFHAWIGNSSNAELWTEFEIIA